MAGSFNLFLTLSRLLFEAQRVLRNLLIVYLSPSSIDSSSFDTHSRENHFPGHSRKQSSSTEFHEIMLIEFDNHLPGHSRKQSSSAEFDENMWTEFDNHFPGHSREHRCSKDNDITNIFTLLRKKCGLFPPPTGWNALPHDNDLSLSADITRIKWYRKEIVHKSERGAKLTEEEYSFFKENTVSSLRRIVQDYSGTDFEAVTAWEKSVHECLTSPITEDDEKNVEKLKAWYLKDVEEEQLETSETDDWNGGAKEVSGKTVENEEKHSGAETITVLEDVEEEQLETSETDDWNGGAKEVSGKTVENEEKHSGAETINVLEDVEEEQLETSETDDWNGGAKEVSGKTVENEEKHSGAETIPVLEDVEEEQLETSETDDWDGGVKGVSGKTVENEEKHSGAETIPVLEDVEEEQLETSETDDWDGGAKEVSGKTVENEEKHSGAETIPVLEDVEEEQLETSETDDWDGGAKEVSGKTVENEEKHSGAETIPVRKDVEEEQLETSETDDWDGGAKEVSGKTVENEEKHSGAETIPVIEDVEEEQLETSETDDWDGGAKEVSGKTVENEEKHSGAETIPVRKDVEEEQLKSNEKDGLDWQFNREHSLIEIHCIKIRKESSLQRHSCFFSAFIIHKTINEIHGLLEFYIARGRKEVDSGHYKSAPIHFLNALNSSASKEAALLRASLQSNIGCAYLLANNNQRAMMALNQALQIMNCASRTEKKDKNFRDRTKDILFVLKNNHACVELQNGNLEEALSIYKNLYEDAKDELVKEAELKGANLPRLPVEIEEGSGLSPNSRSDKQLNLVIVAINYSQACLLSGKLVNIVDVLKNVIQMCQGCKLQLVVSARLARISTVLGMKRQAKDLVALHDVDCLTIQEVIENDSLKPFSVVYTDDICRLLAYNGERSKARELLETAIRVCQEMHFKQHPTVMSLEKTKEELFPTLVMEKACLSLEEDNSRLINVFVEYALEALSNDSDRGRLLSELNAFTKSLSSCAKSFADVYTSEKQPTLSTESPIVTFISTIYGCVFLLHEKSGSKVESYLQNQLAKIISFSYDPEENDMSTGISLLSDNESCRISSLCSLLETALLQHADTTVVDICISLVSYLPRGPNEDLNEVEYWYKDYCGLLSYFVATNHVQISGNKILLYVIVASGSGLKTPADVGHLPDEKALFKKIALGAAESQECSSNTSEANAKCFVFLRSQDLVDIGDLRRINNTIVLSVQSLESSSTNTCYHRSLLIEVGPEIDPSNVSGLCLQLHSLKCCFESSGADCYDPTNEPSAQQLYLQKLQKTLTFKEELDVDVFTAVFQYTFCNPRIVDVRYKTRKKVVCLMKEPPFSVLTLYTKENTVHLTIQDVGDECFRDGNRGNDTTQLIDDTVDECLEKLGICTNGPRDVWKRLSAEQTEGIPIFDVEEDELERAFKTNARLTAELKYLKSKQERQRSRIKKLNDNLSEMELRVGLLQHFAQVIFTDEDKMEAVENWITRKRTGQADQQEEPSNEARYEVEDILGSMANDELAELLAEVQRLDPVITEDEASGGSRGVSSNEDIDGAELRLLSDKQRIFLEETREETREETIEKSEGKKHQDFIEKTKSSNRPKWHFPSSESTHDHFSEESELPFLIEGYTQTDSLSSVQEFKDKTVQTDPVPQTNVETLENVGMADFRRDRAERQLRKSRLSQDVLAFKNRPRESSASFQEFVVTGYFSEGMPPYSFTSESLPEPWRSKASIASQESRHETLGVLSEGAQLDFTSSGFSEQLPPRCSIISQESSYGTETSPNSITSSSLPDPWTSMGSEAASNITEDATSKEMSPDSIFRGSSTQIYPSESIVIEASSDSTEDATSKEMSPDSIFQGSATRRYPSESIVIEASSDSTEDATSKEMSPVSIFRGSLTQQYPSESIVIEASSDSTEDATSKEMSPVSIFRGSSTQRYPSECIVIEASSDSTEDVTSKEMSPDSIFRGYSTQRYPSKCIVIEASSDSTEEASSKETPHESTSSDFSLEQLTYNRLIAGKEESHETKDSSIEGTLQDAVNSFVVPRQISATSVVDTNENERIPRDSASDCGSLEGANRVVSVNEMPDLTMPDKTSQSSPGESGNTHFKKQKYDHAFLHRKKCGLAMAREFGDKRSEIKAHIVLGDAYLNKQEYDDAISCGEKCLSIAQQCGDKEDEMQANMLLGSVYLNKQEYDDAITYSRKGLAMAQECGDKDAEMQTNIVLGNAYLNKQEYDDAISYSKKGLAIAQECGDKENEMQAHMLLCDAHLNKGEDDDVISYNERCLNMAREISKRKPDINEMGPKLLMTGKPGIRKTLLTQSRPQDFICRHLREKSQEGNDEHLDVVDGRHAHQEALNGTCANIFVLPQTDNKGERNSRSSGNHNIDPRISSSVEAKCKRRRTEFDRGGVDKQRTQKYHRHQECYCGHVGRNGDKPSKGSPVSSEANGRDNERTQFLEYVESDNCDHTSLNTKRIDFSSGVSSKTPDETSTNDVTSRKPSRDDVKMHYQINKHNVGSADQSPGTSNVAGSYASCTVLGNFGSSKTTEQEKSVSQCITGEDTLRNNECSQGGHPTFRCNVQSNTKLKTTNKDSEFLGEDVGPKVGNGQHMSLPPLVLHEVSKDEKISERSSPSPPYLQQGDENEACLSTIKETVDTRDINTVWTSQGARPKRISPLHDDGDDDYIVSGVDTSFLARHSRDSSLTRSVYSRTRVSTHHSPFLSLPFLHERAEVSSIARTWPICDERRAQDQKVSSVFDDNSRAPYKGLLLDKRKESVIYQDKEIKELPLSGTHHDVASGTLPGSQSDVVVGTVPLSESHPVAATDRVPMSESHPVGATDRVPMSESHPVGATDRVPVPEIHPVGATDRVPMSESHPVGATDRVPVPESHPVGATDRVPMSESHPVGATDRVPMSESHPVAATDRVPMSESHPVGATDRVPMSESHPVGATDRVPLSESHPVGATDRVPLSESPPVGATDRVPLSESHPVGVTDRLPLSESHPVGATDRVPVPEIHPVGVTDRVPLSESHPVGATDRVPLSESHPVGVTDRVPLSESHPVGATDRVPLPGSQSEDTTVTALPGSHSEVPPTGTVPLPGPHSGVPPTGTVTLPGRHSDVATKGSSSPSNRRHPHVEWQHLSTFHFNSENSSNGIVNFSPTKDTDSLSDDDDSYKTADDSFSSLDSLEDQVKRSKMTWSQMSASAMFETELDHDDDDDDDDEEENRSNEVQPENRKVEVKNERTEGRARKTELGGATSSSPRKDFARREQTVRTTGPTSTEQATAQRVSADVIDAKERELRQVREREREQRLKREVEENKRRLEASQRQREQNPPSTPQPARLPVQESASEWPCSHYKRRCEIKFPCCEEFYYCHRCHNESDSCPKDDKKALHGTHLRCLVCLTEQEITENSHHCIHCKTQLSEYFCGICKHFTGNEKKPYHCKPCGICRIHSDRSFHCEVCNVCLDERLRNNHICRPDSGHDECCICLEDAFGGCQILPCSHKVHRECAIAMLQNGVRKCPVCRHPLNQSMQRGQSS